MHPYTRSWRDLLPRGGGVTPFSPFPSLQKKLQDQRQCIVAEFEQGHQFLREREQRLLDQLAKLEQELTEGREKYKTRGVGELARLALVISELEGKAQQPAAELMQVRDLPGAGSRETRTAGLGPATHLQDLWRVTSSRGLSFLI